MCTIQGFADLSGAGFRVGTHRPESGQRRRNLFRAAPCGHITIDSRVTAVHDIAPMSPASLDTESHHHKVFARSIATLYEQAPKVLVANVINAGVVVAVLWGRVASILLWGFLASMLAMVAVRWALGRGFSASAPPSAMATWARRFLVGSAISGLIWGAGATVLFVPDDPATHVLLAFVVGGMAAGASSSIASHLPAFYAFIVPALAPLVIRFALVGDRFHWGMFAMLTLFGLLVTMIARTTHRTIVESHRLGFVNDALVERLGDAHQELEGANVALERRVADRTAELEAETVARREAERRLHRTQKLEAVGRLTGGVAHDFNNLLTVIVGALEAIDGCVIEDRRAELVRQAREAALRGGGLTRSLLAFSRREQLHPEVVDPGEVITRLTGPMVRRTLPDAIDIQVDVPDQPRLIEVDRAQFETAVLNLILNARDAMMPRGGTLTVLLRTQTVNAGTDSLRPGDYVEIYVADTGAGIAPELLDRIFEPFFTTKGEDGTGLGLSMVYGFADQSGGAIRIDSKLGFGTSASLFLPRVEAKVIAQSSAQPEPIARGDGETVLVVEDEDDVRMLTMQSLRGLGYAPLGAATAGEGLEVLGARPDVRLVMTDIMMPGGMDGLALAREIRARRPGLPVVVASGYSEGPEDATFPRLAKPYRRVALARTLRKALRPTAPV